MAELETVKAENAELWKLIKDAKALLDEGMDNNARELINDFLKARGIQ